jgi:hypothetical protein
MRTIITLTITAFLLTGCAADWMKVNCGWTDQVLPIQPSRKDKPDPAVTQGQADAQHSGADRGRKRGAGS